MSQRRPPPGSRVLRLISRVASLALLIAVLGCPDAGNQCECFVCDSAVSLTVVDADSGAGLEDYFVETIVNGDPRGEPAGCREGERDGASCRFGQDFGVYHVIVRAPGYETGEVSARVAEERNSELCCRACMSAKEVTVALAPL